MDIFWIEALPWNDATGAAAIVHATNADLSIATTLYGLDWLPVIDGGPLFSTTAFSGAFTGSTDTSRGQLSLIANAGDIDDWAALTWPSRPVRIWGAEVDTTVPYAPRLGSVDLIFDGLAESFDPDQATLHLRNLMPNGLVATETFKGTGGLEGAASLVNQKKPLSLGQHRNRAPVLLNAGKLLFVCNAAGSLEGMDAVREAGRKLDQPFVYQPTFAALDAATVPATEIHVHLESGAFRLGFDPQGDITADFRGKPRGGTYPTNPVAIAYCLLNAAGWPSNKIDLTATNALVTAVGFSAQYHDDGGTDVADALTQLFLGCGGYWDVDQLGVFYAGLVQMGATPDFTVGDEGAGQYDILDTDFLPTRAPFWRNRVGFGFNPSRMTYADTATGASPEQLALIESVADLVDGTVDVFFQANAPAGGNERDLWNDTDDGKWYKRTGGQWVLTAGLGALGEALAAAAGAQAAADGKIALFYSDSQPASPADGDLWTKPSETPRTFRTWKGGAWQAVSTLGADLSTNIIDTGSGSAAIVPRTEIRTPLGTAAAIAGQAPAATDSSIQPGATRDVALTGRETTNDKPGYYLALYPNRTVVETKQPSVFGLPYSFANQGALTTVVTGSAIRQTFVDYGTGRTWVRTHRDADTWSAWAEVYNQDRKPAFDMDLLEGFNGALATLLGFKTSQGTAAGFQGQGLLATLSGLAFGGPYLSGFGALAGKALAYLGTDLADSFGTVLSNAQVITGQGTAAGIAGQSLWATFAGLVPSNVQGQVSGLGIDGWVTSGIRVLGSGAGTSTAQLASYSSGSNIATNPEFRSGLTGWGLYDNSGGGHTSIVLTALVGAPNSSGQCLRIRYDGNGQPESNPQPGWGGAVQYVTDGGYAARPGFYSRGTTIHYKVVALLPADRTINFANNQIGTPSSIVPLTSLAGTGDWQTYVFEVKIGTSGVFSSWGFLYAAGGPNTAFEWFIAKADQIDLTSSQKTYMGTNLRDEDGVARGGLDLITLLGTAGAFSGQTAWATLTAPTAKINFLQPDGTMQLGVGKGLLNDGGTGWLTNGGVITDQGTAAGIAGQGWGATAARAGLDNTYVAKGANLLPNSDQQGAVTTWKPGYNPAGIVIDTFGFARNVWGYDTYALSGRTQNVAVHQPSAGNGTDVIDFEYRDYLGEWVEVTAAAGDRFIYSLYVGQHRCNAQIYCYALDGPGNYLTAWVSATAGDYGSLMNKLRTPEYTRASVIIDNIPEGTTRLRFWVRKFSTYPGPGDSYMWWAAPMVERAAANQTEPSPYVAGPPSTTRELGYTGDFDANNTGRNTAAGILNQGALATQGSARYGDQIANLPVGIQPGNMWNANYVVATAVAWSMVDGASVETLRPGERGANVTEGRTASGILNQGGLATASQITNDGQLGGQIGYRLLPSNADGNYLAASRVAWDNVGNTVQAYKPQEVGANVTEARSAASIAGQSYLATNYPARLYGHPQHGDTYLNAAVMAYSVESGSNTVQALRPQDAGANVTENRTAAAFVGQTSWATFTASTTIVSKFRYDGTLAMGVGGGIATEGFGQWLTDSIAITSYGYSAGFVNQGTLATKNQTDTPDIVDNAVSSVVGTTGDVVYVDTNGGDGVSQTLTTSGKPMKIDVCFDATRLSGNAVMKAQLYATYNGQTVAMSRQFNCPTVANAPPISFFALVSLGAGTQVTFFVRYSTANGSWQASGQAITVTELKK